MDGAIRMTNRIVKNRIVKKGYQITESIYQLVEQEVIPDSGMSADDFWQACANIFDEFIPRNKQLLAFRETLQTQIDQWHLNSDNQPFCQKAYQEFLTEIGYLIPEKQDFNISTKNIDDEVALIAGPQLVVPLMNARFALNAANARWGSLYDALYGTDVIDECDGATKGKNYNPKRGKKVQAYAKRFLDEAIPLTNGSHADASRYHIVNQQLLVTLNSGEEVSLQSPDQLVGFNGTLENLEAILCRNNGLHIEIKIDRNDLVGKTDPAFVKDIILESALTTIQDCEDSIAAVDSEDKTIVYRNWLGLMKGDLTEIFNKNGKVYTRRLNPDRSYLTPDEKPLTLLGRSLQFIRNVGHLMTTDCILTADNDEVPEGILDALMTCLISLHDLNGKSKFKNSAAGSIYIVKPKMHGAEEVQFTVDLFSRIEEYLELSANTIKIGIMDEERRTSVNLKECIRVAKDRIAFINTGFLDRTGDEIHTSMQAGAMARKDRMKNEKWIAAYEARNVQIGLQAGFMGKAQIGKGMWATPDEMSAMMSTKSDHLKAGANCAWVPSPTAATLHAIHYHQSSVSEIQKQLISQSTISKQDSLMDLLTIPLLKNSDSLSDDDIQNELDNNVQGLLGYVVRWIDQGIGCSKVPDINNVGKMEDRATLRISSQHICNWLHHKILNETQVMQTLKRMAKVVDQQNSSDNSYIPMADNFESSIAFNAAIDLIFKGKEQPGGYTEPLLHEKRKQMKAN